LKSEATNIILDPTRFALVIRAGLDAYETELIGLGSEASEAAILKQHLLSSIRSNTEVDA
jgi:hypothetical protein